MFDFKGQVISAWDIALATMSCGEVSTITCSPHYGYGALGQPPKIPGDSVLIFDIELIRFEGVVALDIFGVVLVFYKRGHC